MTDRGRPAISRGERAADRARMDGLRERIDRGDYDVDSRVVAEAILARRHGGGLRALCSEMLVAAQAEAGRARKPNALAGDDPA